jgi:hypothetical protein
MCITLGTIILGLWLYGVIDGISTASRARAEEERFRAHLRQLQRSAGCSPEQCAENDRRTFPGRQPTRTEPARAIAGGGAVAFLIVDGIFVVLVVAAALS